MSFKVKLVAYFLLVSLLPLGAAGFGLHSMAHRSESRRVDVRLGAGLRAVLGADKDEVERAASPSFQQALERGDKPALRRLLANTRGPWLRSRLLTTVPARTIGPTTEVAVASPRRILGTLVAGVPLNPHSLASLRSRAGLSGGDTLVVVDHGVVVGGSPELRGERLPTALRARTVTVAGKRYRTLATSRDERGGSTA